MEWREYTDYISTREGNLSKAATRSVAVKMITGQSVEDVYRPLFDKGASIDIDRNRWRSPFQLDRDRIIYSELFLRLTGKTQILTGSRSLIENRLSHSLRVAQISRSICFGLRLNADLAEAISYGHDIGHTPFGHTGERRLLEWLRNKIEINGPLQRELIGSVDIPYLLRCKPENKYAVEEHFTLGNDPNEEIFMHGRQGFRLLTEKYKEAKRPKFTAPVLVGIWRHSLKNTGHDKDFSFIKKDESGNIAFALNAQDFTPECQVVRYADDIASIMDLSEALRAGFLERDQIDDLTREYGDLADYLGHAGIFYSLEKGNCSQLITYFINDLIRNNEEKMDSAPINHNDIEMTKEAKLLLLGLQNLIKKEVHKSNVVSRVDQISGARITALCNWYDENPKALFEDIGVKTSAPGFPYQHGREMVESANNAILRYSIIADWISLLTDNEVCILSESSP